VHTPTLSYPEALLRLALALLVGLTIGVERERGDHAAGMRTYALVALGSTLFMLVSAYGAQNFFGAQGTRVDPTRIAAQVVTGIGFIGGGLIFVQRSTVRGLTTAAGIWAIAAIGLAIGIGQYFVGLVGAALMLAVLMILKPVQERYFPPRQRVVLDLRVPPERLPAVYAILREHGVTVHGFASQLLADEQQKIVLKCSGPVSLSIEALQSALAPQAGVAGIEATNLQDESGSRLWRR
jgi:putative Mg2+ transporter-C (MgtC) family protein